MTQRAKPMPGATTARPRGRMRHIVWLTALILGLWIGAATAQESTIGSVLVEGNVRIEVDTVRSYMAIGPGDEFDSDAVNESLKSLFATGLFADVAIRREGSALVVRVIENPIINRVAFEGNDAIEDSELEAEIQLQPRAVYTRPRGAVGSAAVDRDLPAQRSFRRHHRAQGHPASAKPGRSRFSRSTRGRLRKCSGSTSSATLTSATVRSGTSSRP